MVKIPQPIYRAFWLLFSREQPRDDKDGRQLLTIAGLLLLVIAALSHASG